MPSRRSSWRHVATALTATSLITATAAAAQAAQLPVVVADPVPVAAPDTVSFPSGPLSLRGIVYRPRGAGPFPAVLFNHGSGRDYTKEVAAVGPMYASHGFVFFAPSRRGQWLSSNAGPYIVDSLDAAERGGGAEARARALVGLLDGPHLDDVAAALSWLRRLSGVDAGRIVVSGNSFGGIMTVLAAERLDGLRAALDFAGAAQTWASTPLLQARMKRAVAHSKVPMMFVQASNDYDLAPSRSLAAEMATAGLVHELRIFPAYGSTVEAGHSFGYFGGSVWAPEVFAFLSRISGR